MSSRRRSLLVLAALATDCGPRVEVYESGGGGWDMAGVISGGGVAASGLGGPGGASGGGPSGGGAGGDSSGGAGGGLGGLGGNPSCDDNVHDGDETDIDCGGTCPPCAVAQKCLTDADCSSIAPGCDVSLGGCTCNLTTGTCAASHCVDQRTDGDESDVDCGGSCAGCGPGKECGADDDCSTTISGCDLAGCYCDALSLTCVFSHCFDHKTDSSESGVDCGGGDCVCPTSASTTTRMATRRTSSAEEERARNA